MSTHYSKVLGDQTFKSNAELAFLHTSMRNSEVDKSLDAFCRGHSFMTYPWRFALLYRDMMRLEMMGFSL